MNPVLGNTMSVVIGLSLLLALIIVPAKMFLKKVDDNDKSYEGINYVAWGIAISLLSSFIVGIIVNSKLSGRLEKDKQLSKKKKQEYSKRFNRGVLIGFGIHLISAIVLGAIR